MVLPETRAAYLQTYFRFSGKAFFHFTYYYDHMSGSVTTGTWGNGEIKCDFLSVKGVLNFSCKVTYCSSNHYRLVVCWTTPYIAACSSNHYRLVVHWTTPYIAAWVNTILYSVLSLTQIHRSQSWPQRSRGQRLRAQPLTLILDPVQCKTSVLHWTRCSVGPL